MHFGGDTLQELEIKIIHINVDDIRTKIKEANLEMVKMENQTNNIYDFPDKTLEKSRGYARIRIVEDLKNKCTRVYMTTKKLLSQDKYKIMEENEVVISDSNAGHQIFLALGLKQNKCIKKYRESYKYKNSLIEIDIHDKSYCPFPYLEIESTKEEEIEEVAKLLGYTMADTTSETLTEILKKEG